MNKHLKKLIPFVDKHPRLMAVLFSPVFIVGCPLTILVVYPLAVLQEGIMNRKAVWEDISGPMIGALCDRDWETNNKHWRE